MMRVVGVSEGMLVCPEGAAALEGAFQLAKQGFIDPHEDVVVLNTGSGLKYGESLQGEAPIHLERGAVPPRIERQLGG
jgi:threonine synthase